MRNIFAECIIYCEDGGSLNFFYVYTIDHNSSKPVLIPLKIIQFNPYK